MSASRYIDAKLFDFTADAHLVIDGQKGEHLIVKLGQAQIENLDFCIQKFREKQEPAAQ